MILTVEQKKARSHYGVKSSNMVTVKDVDLEKRIVTGLYNAYWFFDSDRDVCVPGCAKKSITERGPNTNVAGKIKHALFHDLTKLPGKIMVLDEREVEVDGKKVKGIYFETKMLNTADGNDTLVKYQEGVYDNHSIGFRYIDMEYVEKGATGWDFYLNQLLNPQDADNVGYMFVVKEVNLFEGSTVAFGANKLTPYLGSKSESKEVQQLKLFERIGMIEKQLKIGALSDEALHTLELQLSQVKQMISELFNDEPDLKSTLEGGPGAKSTVLDYNYLMQNLKL
jgi:hypothetical protein